MSGIEPWIVPDTSIENATAAQSAALAQAIPLVVREGLSAGGASAEIAGAIAHLLGRRAARTDQALRLIDPATAPEEMLPWLANWYGWGWLFVDPDDPNNKVLKLVATGATEHMHNHGETTLMENGETHRIRDGVERRLRYFQCSTATGAFGTGAAAGCRDDRHGRTRGAAAPLGPRSPGWRLGSRRPQISIDKKFRPSRSAKTRSETRDLFRSANDDSGSSISWGVGRPTTSSGPSS